MFDIQTSYSALRANLASLLDNATRDNKTILVTRQSGENAVILSEREYASLVETVHLMQSPANARRLIEALEWSQREPDESQSLEELRKEVERESQGHEKKEPSPSGYRVQFHPHFREDMIWWARQDKKVAERIWNLIEDILDGNPFSGMGKPEPLKYDVPNTWSRRITQEHRLVYRIERQTVYFLQARFHYQK